MSLFLSSYWLQFSTNVAIIAIAALGLYVCFIAGQFSLGHGALLGAGAYGAGSIATKTGLSFEVGVLVGVAAGLVMGLAMGALLALRIREFYLAIGTLAFNLAVIVVINNTDSLGGPTGMLGIPLETTANMAVVAAILIAVAIHLLDKTRLGRAMRAIHDDEVMAAANGVRVWKVKLATFTMSGAIMGLAGAMYAHYLGIARPEAFSFARSTELWVPVIVGGATTVLGPLIGAFVVHIVPEIINRQVEVDPLLISGALLILVVLFRPAGLARKGDLRRIRERVRGSSPVGAPSGGLDGEHITYAESPTPASAGDDRVAESEPAAAPRAHG